MPRVIVWDLEGQEKPHCISYVGDPRKLPQVAPEMDRFADAFMKKFRDAGFRTGLTLRPTDYYEPTPGKRDWTHREVKGTGCAAVGEDRVCQATLGNDHLLPGFQRL